MPSTTTINITLTGSPTDYVAPANGFVFVSLQSNGGYSSLHLTNLTTGCGFLNSINLNGYTIGSLLPIKKGQTCRIIYDNYLSTWTPKFVYADGEV